MKRSPLLLSAVIALSMLVAPLPAQAVPAATQGGPAELLRYVGDPNSGTGNALANGQCDVNGDGADDAVVGAWFWDKAPINNLGAAYVLLGGAEVHGGSLADPDDVNAVRIDGPSVAPPVAPATSVNGTFAAFAVACIGDVNGDGLDDIAVSDYDLQRAYIVFGAKNFTGLSLDSLGDRGYIAQAPLATAGNFSFSLAPVGDINNDGKDDFAVSEVVADTQGRNNNGRVWILAGRADISSVDVANPLPGQVLLTVDGALADERLGQVAKAGDVNGDGIDDFVLGSYTSTPWGAGVVATGAAYVVFGGSTGSIDLATLGNKGFAIHGPKRQRDRLGISVSPAGDVDGDGKADLLIGADGVTNATTGPRNGGAAVVLGSASTDTVYTDPVAANGQAVFTCPAGETPGTCATPTRRGYWINGAVNADATGYSVAGIGDVNADGVPDFALGAYGYDPINPAAPATTMSGAGALFVVFGRTTGTVQELSALTDATGYRIDGLKAGDRLGRQVGLIGDFDKNGARDVVASGDLASRTAATGAQNGELVVLLMGQLVTDVAVTGPVSVTPDQVATFTAAVTKRAGDRAALAEGTVAFTRGGAAVEGCAAVAVTAGAASCAAAFGSESSDPVVATYSGSARLASSTGAPLDFAVVKTATITAISSSLVDPLPGQLVQLRATVTSDGVAAGAGTVSFLSDGKPVTGCAAVPVAAGDAVCTTSWPDRADRDLTAAYAGTAVLAASTSGALTISVGANSVVKPAGHGSFIFGTAPAALAGEIRGGDHLPTGIVEIREGSTVLGRTTLAFGEYSVQLGATSLAPGAHTLTVAYLGDGGTRAAERNIAVSVAKAPSKLTVTRSRGTLKGKQRLTLTITARATGVAATGTAQISVGSKTVKTVTLVNGRARYTLPRLGKKGTRTISVTYRGSDQVAGTSAKKKVVQK